MAKRGRPRKVDLWTLTQNELLKAVSTGTIPVVPDLPPPTVKQSMRERFIESIENIYRECIGIVKKKNHDYAKDSDPYSNFRLAELLGIGVEKAILLRVSDKIARISNVLDNGGITAVDENIKETLKDAINYLAILNAFIEHETSK